jgi:hypothetical protein
LALLIFRRKSHAQPAMPYGRWLSELGEPLVLFTNDRSDDDANYAHVEYLPSFDEDGLLELRVLDLVGRFQFTRIFAQSEHDLTRAAHLREWLGIPGQSRDSVRAYRDKVYMKSLVEAAGVKVPSFAAISAPLDLLAFSSAHGFPVVVKPRAEAGGRGVRILHSMQEARAWLSAPFPGDYMAETFVSGPLFHVDGLATSGRITFGCTSRYLNTCLGYQDQLSLGSFLLDPGDPLGERLLRATQQVITTLPATQHLAFHAEFFLTEGGDIVFCEIAARPGGSRTADNIEAVHGFNMYQEWARQSVGLPALALGRVPVGSAGNLLIPPRHGYIRSIPDVVPFDWVLDYRKNVAADQYCELPTFCSAHVASFVVTGKTAAEVETRLSFVDEWFGAHTRWEYA